MSGLPILDDVRVASPCTVGWANMSGDDRVRHCAQCDLDVYNVAAMTREDAEDLLFGREGRRTCVRLFRRFDGTIITRDCPVGFAKVRRAVRRRVMLAVTFTLALFGVGAAIAATKVKQCGISDGDAFDSPLLKQIVALFKGQPAPQAAFLPLEGDVAYVPPATSPAIPQGTP